MGVHPRRVDCSLVLVEGSRLWLGSYDLCSLVLVEGSRLWLVSFMITCVSGIVLTCVGGRLETVSRHVWY